METPLVSVSLVAFNAEAYIRDAIEGCLMQEVDFPYEIIIHDDASTDATPDIIKAYAEKHPDKIVPILQTENQFSQGIEIIAENIIPTARGKYIAFLEADDYWTDPQKLNLQVNFLETHPEVSMCFTATKHVYASGSKQPQLKRYRNNDSLVAKEDVILKGGRLLDMASAMARRSVFQDLPDWYYQKQIWDVTVPLLSLMHGKIQYLNKITTVYRVNVPGSWTQHNASYFERRKLNLIKTVRFNDGFDKETDYQYHKLINQKNNLLIVEILLLSNQRYENIPDYFHRLSFLKKLEYQIFNFLGSFRLWERYIQIKRLVTGN